MSDRMNAYIVDAGDCEYVADIIGGFPRYETERCIDIVFAASRGKARTIFLSAHKTDDVEWNDIKHVRLVLSGVVREPGIAPSSDVIWKYQSKKIDKIVAGFEPKREADNE